MSNPMAKLVDELTLKNAKLKRQLAHKEETIWILCEEWADDHTHLQNLCRSAGCTEHEVDGDSNGVPGIIELADLLAGKLAALVQLKAKRPELGFVIERRDGIAVIAWKSGGCRPATDPEVALWEALQNP